MGNTNSDRPSIEKISKNGLNCFMKYATVEMQGWRNYMEDSSFNQKFIYNHNEYFISGVFDGHGGADVSRFVCANFTNCLMEGFFNEYNDSSSLSSSSLLTSHIQDNEEDKTVIINYLINSFIKLDDMLKDESVNDYLKSVSSIYRSSKQYNISKYIYKPVLNKKNLKKEEENSNFNSASTQNTDFSFEKETFFNSFSYLRPYSYENTTNTSNNTNSSSLSDSETTKLTTNPEKSIGKIANLCKKKDILGKHMGSTANVILMDKSNIFIANLGDSIAVMYKNTKAIKLNTEHKTSILSERERITKAGLSIINNRIEGKLNLTRAFGDFCFKDNQLKSYDRAVTCMPEIVHLKRTSDIEFIIHATDGIWDCVDVQKFCDLISLLLKEGKQPEEIITNFMNEIVSKTKVSPIGTDNMTCTIIVF